MTADHEDFEGEPTREQIDRTSGPVVLEFGASWCGHCRSFAPERDALLEKYPAVRHVKVEDGPGQPLGRSFQVKLWPTFVFLLDGRVVARAVRPGRAEVARALEAITRGGDSAPGQSETP